MTPPAVIDWGLIGEVVWVSLVMGVGAVALFSAAIFASSRAAEARRTGDGSSSAYGVMAAAALILFAAAVVFAITVTLNKS